MYWENDYTKQEYQESSEEKRKEEESDNDSNLELYLQYCHLWNSQNKCIFSNLKRDRVFDLYKLLNDLAFIHNGKVSLDINKEKMSAKLIYWGECIAVLSDDLDISKKILLDLLGASDMFYLSSVDGGIEIRIVQELCEKIETENGQKALAELRETIHNQRVSSNHSSESNEP